MRDNDRLVIQSADEFVRLRSSDDPEEYARAAHGAATEDIWLDVIDRFPEMRFWVAQNKTVPLSILELLRRDPDANVVRMVRSKRSWARAHPEDSTRSDLTGLTVDVPCPRCDHGTVNRHLFAPTSEVVRICDECESLWFDGDGLRADVATDFASYSAARGGSGTWSELSTLG
ncbi:hypothetical protein F9L07_25785 [Pimelobacter simplex]|uniref:Transcription factor zinc-finger domain-containing protein n=1 Tax=Nocardioides simplex TaxID=2045 RepID=A0A7J5DRJ3_NOCSI|nr:hypothetical protein [Pimelobacter simplex]KAB2807465.1 hypothetical protein F9L07_25785 [Pimelobacter simplex]